MKYLWLIFPAISGTMMGHMGYSWFSVVVSGAQFLLALVNVMKNVGGRNYHIISNAFFFR